MNKLKIKIILKGLSFLTLFFIAFSCQKDKPEGSLRYSYEEYFLLDNEEKEQPTDSISQNKYSPIAILGKYQMPLNRAITHNNYTVYIGLAMNAKPIDITKASIKMGEYDIFTTSENNLFFKKDSMFVFRHTYNEPIGNSTVVVNWTSSDSVIINNFYEKRNNLISKKLVKSQIK